MPVSSLDRQSFRRNQAKANHLKNTCYTCYHLLHGSICRGKQAQNVRQHRPPSATHLPPICYHLLHARWGQAASAKLP